MGKRDFLKLHFIKLLHIFPIRKKSIFCNQFNGRGYDENPRAIIEKLHDKQKYKIYWVLSKANANTKLPDGITPVVIGTLKYYYTIATSKIWISNVRLQEYYTKRKKQFYIQTWHGDLGIKKIEYDVYDMLSPDYQRCMAWDNTLIDLFISGSKFFTNLIRKSFRYEGEVLQCGAPKNDPIVNNDHEKEKAKLKKNLKIKEENLLLYMPTFRVDYSHDPYNINLDKVKDALERKTHTTWKVLCKMHPNVEAKYKTINCTDYISLDDYNNTQQAIVACDILISDYSSVVFDALIADRIVYIYANDEEIYTKNERGLYFKISELPFKSFKTTAEMINHIKKNGLKDAKEKYASFVKEQQPSLTGKASETVAAIIAEKCA